MQGKVWFTIDGGDNKYVRAHFQSRYASDSIPCHNIEKLVESIDDIFGKGSYVPYDQNGQPAYASSKGEISYFVQGMKTDALQEARETAIWAWGSSSELDIQTWSRRFRTIVNV